MANPKTRHNDRRCVATGAALSPDAPALRFVRSPDGVLTLDLSGKLPGRGAWLTATRDALLQGVKKGAFARGLKESVTLAEGLDADSYADQIEKILFDRALSQLGLARKAGQCLTGFEIVKGAAPKMIAYITPQDASEDGVTKIKRVVEATSQAPHIVFPIEAVSLAEAIGTPGAVHLALVPGKAAQAARYEALRASGFAKT